MIKPPSDFSIPLAIDLDIDVLAACLALSVSIVLFFGLIVAGLIAFDRLDRCIEDDPAKRLVRGRHFGV